MPTLQVTVRMDNDAFAGDPRPELESIFATVLEHLTDDRRPLYDSNGNSVGRLEIAPTVYAPDWSEAAW